MERKEMDCKRGKIYMLGGKTCEEISLYVRRKLFSRINKRNCRGKRHVPRTPPYILADIYTQR